MNVQNDLKVSSTKQMEKAGSIRTGGTYKAEIMEQTSSKDVKVKINNQEVQMKIEGKLPQSGNFNVQITDATSEPVQGKVVQAQTPPTPTMPNVSDELKSALQQIQKTGASISKTELHALKQFMEKGSGTPSERLAVIARMASKGLPFTQANLQAVHAALNGGPLGDALQSITSEVSRPSVEQLLGQLQIEMVEEEVFRSTTGQSEFTKALQHVRTIADFATLIQTLKNMDFSTDMKSILNEAIAKAEGQYEEGKELAARQEIAQTLLAHQSEANQVQSETEQSYRLQGDLLANIPADSRQMIMTTITQKLAEATHEFKQVQREIVQNLQTAEQMMRQAPVQARPSLEQVIKQLDQTILKSDFMLYTNMETEKKLLQASGDLHLARKLLAKGEFSAAREIVQNVRSVVEQVEFKPSEVRVTNMVAKELLRETNLPIPKHISQMIADSQHQLKQEPTARHAMEFLRTTGLFNETDVSRQLLSNQSMDENIKSLLLKLAQQSSSQRVDQAMQNITGQQLLAKADQSSLQTLIFSLPIILQDKLEDVKIFLQSNQKNETLDWENCSLYFLLETKKYGDLGILLKSSDRHLSITLKNDELNFEERFNPVIEKSKERLEEIGYQVSSLKFTKLTVEEQVSQPKQQESAITNQSISESGYDFSI